ncbi:MAG: voltage-gated sodium channel [Marinosulfonomonas sp.]|nr:MAG: voltage-gated sodium channel [Marinosulfonomonas sp.]
MIKSKLAALINQPRFEYTIMILIVINSAILALETSPSAMALAGPILMLADKAILTVFVVELLARMLVDFRGFWRDPWRIFDFFVVAIALVPATGPLAVLRALRILRVLRLLTSVPAMRRVVSGLLRAIPGLSSIVFLIGLIFFVFSVISTKLFAQAFPEWFGSIGASSYTLFQIMTLESWSMGIVRPVMEVFPLAWLLFVPFIVITAFTVLNLFIGVIVDAMAAEHEEEAREGRDNLMAQNQQILREISALRMQFEASQNPKPSS